MAKKLLLIDTVLISHALTPNQTQAYSELFETLEKTYRFAVTGFTKYEIMRSSDKEHRDKIHEFLEQNMTYVSLSKVLMDFAARVCYLYANHPSTKGHNISSGDIINAAFSIAWPCPLLTIDNNDYPTPFFAEMQRERITYISKKGKDVMDTVYILAPDLENTKQCFARHDV